MKQKKNISGGRIREARLDQGLTQVELSRKLQTEQGIILSPNTISGIERKQRTVWHPELLAFAEVLNVSPTWLLGCERTQT